VIKILILSLLYIFSFGNNIVKICDDSAGWAPYAYQKNGKPEGFSVALSHEIFKRLNQKVSFEMIPWKRCLYLVEHFNIVHKYEIVADGSYSEKRAKKYYQSLPIYYTHQVLFYSDKKFTKSEILNIIKSDVNRLKMCDVNGYQTEHYKKVLGYTKKIDKSAKNFAVVLKKISIGRCDALIAPKEIVYAEQVIYKNIIPKDIKNVKLNQYKPLAFYFWIAKTSLRGKKLVNSINKEIKIIKNEGIYQKLYNKYVLGMTK